LNYLFIAGTPRSGTSAITELLSAHANIALGMERFKKLYNPNRVTEELFNEKHFFTYNDEETNVLLEGAKYDKYYKNLKQKYAYSTVRGDKYPFLFKNYHTLAERFGDKCQFIYIVRNPYSVASSWNVRAKKPKDKWPLENDYSVSVKHWNDANRRTLNAIKKGYKIQVVEYDKLYTESVNIPYLETIVQTIGIELDDGILKEYEVQISEFNRKIKDKPLDLNDEQKQYIADNIDMSLYHQLFN